MHQKISYCLYLFLFVGFIYFFSGCKNSCQSLCAEIEDFAKECGYGFESDDYRECISGNRWISFSEKKECRYAIPKLEDEWTCDDISVYFDDESLFSQ